MARCAWANRLNCAAVAGRCVAWRQTCRRASVNRIVCYCDDCQAFAHQIGRADLLDPQGGSDIVQLAPAALSFTQGQHHIVGLRLKPNGLYRWYASCCNTPVGNTLTPRIPFVGLLAPAFDKARWDEAVGEPSGAIFGKFAVGEPPPGSTRPQFACCCYVRSAGCSAGGSRGRPGRTRSSRARPARRSMR